MSRLILSAAAGLAVLGGFAGVASAQSWSTGYGSVACDNKGYKTHSSTFSDTGYLTAANYRDDYRLRSSLYGTYGNSTSDFCATPTRNTTWDSRYPTARYTIDWSRLNRYNDSNDSYRWNDSSRWNDTNRWNDRFDSRWDRNTNTRWQNTSNDWRYDDWRTGDSRFDHRHNRTRY